MSNKQNDIIAEQQAEQEQDKYLMLLELQTKISDVLLDFAIKDCLAFNKKVSMQKYIDKIINLFRKYKEAI